MFRHVVLFRWTPSASDAEKLAVAEGLATLPGHIAELRDYRFGSDVHINEGNWDFAVVADFDDREAYLVYRDHPVHTKLIAESIAPIIAERAAVQYELHT